MNTDSTSSRKQDHIELAFKSQTDKGELDQRFYYEPLLSAHPNSFEIENIPFLGREMHLPIWVSSMTGGTEKAGLINKNLARACKKYGMGMGLGSCRIILDDNKYLPDFDYRKEIGDDLPFYANLGIAQLEELIEHNELYKIIELINKLSADGLIIHVNPTQEWLQPEGDRFKKSPLETIETIIDKLDIKIIVKEVGQGMGPRSLEKLINLPVEAIEFAAMGGTNFAKLEILRTEEKEESTLMPFSFIGHSAEEMVEFSNTIFEKYQGKTLCRQLIISGGVKNFLAGYYLTQKSKYKSVYGQASTLLKYAAHSFEALDEHLLEQKKGLEMAKAYLKIRH